MTGAFYRTFIDILVESDVTSDSLRDTRNELLFLVPNGNPAASLGNAYIFSCTDLDDVFAYFTQLLWHCSSVAITFGLPEILSMQIMLYLLIKKELGK